MTQQNQPSKHFEKFLPLTNDLVFKTSFVRSKNSLVSLLNAILHLQDQHRISEITIFNSEIPASFVTEKEIRLDIFAKEHSGRTFLIEMQCGDYTYFTWRVLYYWSRAFSTQLKKGETYKDLKTVYSINFVKRHLFPSEYSHVFHKKLVLKEETCNFVVGGDLCQLHFIELEYFHKTLSELASSEDSWVYLIKEADNMSAEDFMNLAKKFPETSEQVETLKKLNQDLEFRVQIEAREKAERDYDSNMVDQYEKGIEKGKTDGIVEGEAKGKASTLVRQMKLRFAGIPAEIEKCVMECKNIDNLDKAADFILAPDCSVKRIVEILRQK